MMNSLVATALVLILSLGFGCSQETDMQFDFTNDCIKIEIQFEVNVTYVQTDGNRSWVIIPGTNFSDEVPVWDCDRDTASIEITWLEDFTLALNFVADIGESWNVSSVAFAYSTAGNDYFDTPLYDGDILNGTIEEIVGVDWNTSYSCRINSSVNLMSEDEERNQTAEIIIPFIRVQVFSFLTPRNFTTGLECPQGNSGGSDDDDDDKIVPIAVGCALAGLVIIVLIAYLIGRFRNRKTDTYQVLS